jgi:hypothetical protein
MAHGRSGIIARRDAFHTGARVRGMCRGLGLLAWRGSDIVSRAPASPGPLSQSEASLLSVAEAMAGQGHVRISIVRQPGAIRQVLLLLDDKASVDDGMLTNTISMAAGLDAAKGERVDLQRVAFAPGVTARRCRATGPNCPCWPCWLASGLDRIQGGAPRRDACRTGTGNTACPHDVAAC